MPVHLQPVTVMLDLVDPTGTGGRLGGTGGDAGLDEPAGANRNHALGYRLLRPGQSAGRITFHRPCRRESPRRFEIGDDCRPGLSRQKSLNRFGTSAVQTAMLIDRPVLEPAAICRSPRAGKRDNWQPKLDAPRYGL